MKKKPIVGIIDTGTSNIRSVFYALKESGAEIKQIKNSEEYSHIDGLVVPGIGSFGYVMERLKINKLDKIILKVLEQKKPSFFICVGMQILFTESNELGKNYGLKIFNGKVEKIKNEKIRDQSRKVPFIGWNKLIKKNYCEILKNVQIDDFFFFTHSYFVSPANKKLISTSTDYLDFKYCSSISYDKIFATQFHPEKSGDAGVQIYKNFVNLI